MKETYEIQNYLSNNKQTAIILILFTTLLLSLISVLEYNVYAQYYTPDYLLTLSASSLNAQENDNIEFYGSFTIYEDPIGNHPIKILDKDTGKLITQTTTNSQGDYSVNWNAIPKNNSYQLYAVSWDPIEGIELDESNTIKITVKKNIPPPEESQANLILHTLPPKVVDGDVINITGDITSYGFNGNRVFIKINGNTNLIDKINSEREFSVRWVVTSDYVGDVKISAECLCDGENLQSSTQIIYVESKPLPVLPPVLPLKIEIVTNPISGVAPLAVKLESRISGGESPYKYTWDLGDGRQVTSPYLNTNYLKDGIYLVTLTVTDSNHNIKQTSTTINVKEKLFPPEILVSDQTQEGFPITFTADVSYPEKVTSYNWKFGNGMTDSGREVTHVFQDNGSYDVELLVNSIGNSAVTSKKIDVSNVAPTIIGLKSDKSEATVDEIVRIEGEFNDPGVEDTHTIEWYVNDKPILISEKLPAPLTHNQKFKDPGDYTITLVVRDNDGGESRQEISLRVVQPPPWLIIGVGLGAVAGGTGFAAKTLLISKHTTGKISLMNNQQSDTFHHDNNENAVNESLLNTPSVDIEVSWGFEK